MFHISQLLLYSNKYAVKTLIMFINSFPGAQTGQRSRRNGIIDGKFDRGEDYNW